MQDIPTVKVVRNGVVFTINEANYNPKIDVLEGETEPREKEMPTQPAIIPTVIKNGKKHFVVNQATGENLPGFDEAGYSTDIDAWQAIAAAGANAQTGA